MANKIGAYCKKQGFHNYEAIRYQDKEDHEQIILFCRYCGKIKKVDLEKIIN